MRSGNPALRADTFAVYSDSENVMTMTGTVLKTMTLLFLCIAAAAISWTQVAANSGLTYGFIIGGALGGLVLAIITIFAPKASPFTAPFYSMAEGLFLGAISFLVNMSYPGLVLQAVLLTFSIMFIMLTLYGSRIIRVTDKLRMGIAAATGAICLVYLVSFVLSFFGGTIPYIHEGGWIGILFSLVVVGVASFNLLLDFDFIERGAEHGAPKYMEWYAAFGLMVTLIWLYVELLRLLAKLQSRD